MASKPNSKPKPATKHSPKDLIKIGPREVFIDVKASAKQENVKPTTSRALVLRNGKYDIQGTGEVCLMSRISGREKLDLLAEDLVERSKMAISAPFDIQKCLQIAESQYDAFLGDISSLHDHEVFHRQIGAELEARTRYDPKKPEPKTNPSYIANIITTRIHNTYMLASAWKIVRDTLRELVLRGMTKKNVSELLKSNLKTRNLYLVLFRMVDIMVDINQNRFSVLALSSPHYAKYFKEKQTDELLVKPEVVFDHAELREAATSFIDSIIIELCFPKAPYPKFILYQILHDAAEESPKDTKRFSQLMWDAVGDLSECVELHQLLEGPLLTLEAKGWRDDSPKMPPEFELWLNAQTLSTAASEEVANFKDLVFPLSKTARKVVLDNMWTRIDSNYLRITGKDLDDLWQLKGALNNAPQWTSYHINIPNNSYDSDTDEDFPDLLPIRSKKKPKRPLAITNESEGESAYAGMPSLQSVSNSSDDYGSEDDSNSDADLDSDSEVESGYNTEEEDEIRELLREAMDVAHESDWFNTAEASPEVDPTKVADERNNNPFLKLLGSLRGRLFNPNPKLKVSATAGQIKPSQGVKDTVQTQKVTVEGKTEKKEEEAEEEEEEKPHATVKKKKKKTKKKKKPAAAGAGQAPESSQTPSSQTPEVKPVVTSTDEPITAKGAPLASPKPLKKSPTAVSPSKPRPAAPAASAASLPTFETTTNYTQSARTYLSTLESHKVKTKTRGDQASILSNSDDRSNSAGGFLSKLGFSKESTMKEEEQKAARKSWFSKLSRKAEGLMHHLLRTSEDEKQGQSGMRWDDFVKLMTEMGFGHDPSTAGSSVRFIPPGKDDHPITFHKPHPKPYIEAWKLRSVASRLKRHYGWDPEAFINRAQAFTSDPKGNQ